MEAKLPDVNASIVTHRKAAMNGFDKGDYIKTAISFDSIIALLPDDYKPIINTEMYYEKIKGRRLIFCDVCTTLNEKKVAVPTQHARENIETYEMLLSNEDQFLMNQETCLVWTCPNCENTRPLLGSTIRNETFQRPFYTGIIPDMPRRVGLHDRIGFSRKFKDWYQIAFREIENQIGLYRAEYAGQNPDETMVNLEDA